MLFPKSKRKQHLIRTPRFFRLFRGNSQSTFSSGNRVELLRHGGDFFPAMLEAFLEAVSHISLEFYIIKNDSTGNALAETLLSAAARGVEVRLIYDYIGCFDTPRTYFRRLEKGGVACIPFNPPSFKRGWKWFDRRDHRKMAIIDGKVAFMGGMNIADEYAGFGECMQRWRDVGIRLDGPAVAQLENLFRETWRQEGGMELSEPAENASGESGNDRILIVNGGPIHTRSLIRSAFRIAIAGASETINIINPYFVPGPLIIRSLLRAVRRGVIVRMILPARNDIPLVRLVSRTYYAPLLKAGVEIYEREGTILHAKVMLIDDSWGVIGSANLDHRSFHRNFELNVIVDSPVFGKRVSEMFASDLQKSRRIELVEHERRGGVVRLLERLFAPVSWFL